MRIQQRDGDASSVGRQLLAVMPTHPAAAKNRKSKFLHEWIAVRLESLSVVLGGCYHLQRQCLMLVAVATRCAGLIMAKGFQGCMFCCLTLMAR